jgi:hypothetical protein
MLSSYGSLGHEVPRDGGGSALVHSSAEVANSIELTKMLKLRVSTGKTRAS